MLFYRFFSNPSIPLLLFFLSCLLDKTAVNSICLRTCLLLFPPLSQSRCKTRNSFCFLQEKFKKILKLFFVPFFSFSYQSVKELPCFAGCKCNIRFRIPQAFFDLFSRNLFLSDLDACRCFSERFSLLRVQKYHLYLHFQYFSLHNFHVFLSFFLTRW